MIAFLPSIPGYSWVKLIDWMISLDLALVAAALEGARREEPRPDQLLGDRRGTALVAAGGVDRGRDDADGIEPGVLPERLVLDRGRRVDQPRRDLLVLDVVALDLPEPGELDLAGPVVDLGLLGEIEGLEELLGVFEALAVIAVGGHGGGGTDDGEQDERPEQEQGKRDCDLRSRAAAPASSAIPTMASTACEAGLHSPRHDSIGLNMDRIPPGPGAQTPRACPL